MIWNYKVYVLNSKCFWKDKIQHCKSKNIHKQNNLLYNVKIRRL